MILISELEFVLGDPDEVSVPMRGLNDFNLKNHYENHKVGTVSVPMRGLNDFNLYSSTSRLKRLEMFPSPCGV